MKKITLLAILMSLGICLVAQNRLIKGVVLDSVYHTPVAYATIHVEGEQISTVANNIGEFELSVPDSVRSSSKIIVVREKFGPKTILLDTISDSPLTVMLGLDEFQKDVVLAKEQIKKYQSPMQRFVSKTMSVLMEDWIPLGNPETNKLDFGRVLTIPTYNPIEGVRLRAGLATNTRLHPHLFAKGYVAYGFKDKQVKYRGEATYAFNKRAYHEGEYLRNNLQLVYENEMYAPGELHPHAPNDFLLITYRRSEGVATYRRFVELNHEKEYKSGFAHQVWMRQSRFEPQGTLRFLPATLALTEDITLDNAIPMLKTTEVGVTLRYSWREAYEQRRRIRKSIEMTSPTLFITHAVGLKGPLQGEVAYHRTELSLQKRFLLGDAGRLDAVGELYKVWNAVPFPLLVFPNQRYRHHIENNAFFLNNAMEFMADQQATLRATFVADDLLFAKVPFLDALKMKELLSVRISYGTLSDINNPAVNKSLMHFPYGSYEYGKTPYVEGTIGISNLLGLFRIEYVHRFTHRNHPDALLGKIRVDVVL